MAFNDYIDSDYTEFGYFTGDFIANAVQGNGEILSVASLSAELTPADMSYIDPTYIEAGYFEGSEVQGAPQEGGATLSSQGTFSVITNKIHSGTASLNNVVDCYAIPERIVQGEAVLTTEDGVGLYAQAVREYELVAFSNSNLAVNGSKIVEATVIIYGEQDYSDPTYIEGGYFAPGVSYIPPIIAILDALVGKVQEASTDIIVGGQYVDPDYIELGFFDFTLAYGVVGSFVLQAELELYFVPGILEGVAHLSNVSVVAVNIERQRDYNVDMFSVFAIDTQSSKILEVSSDISVLSSNDYIVDRIRGYDADIAVEFNQVAINSRTRNIVSNINAVFSQEVYGARARDIDLFAFSNGQLTADVVAIRDSNLNANTFFNIGTDFIRTRDVGANADSETSIINVPTRIRDTSLETQDAFSFVSTVVATRNVNVSLVVSANTDNQFSLIRGATANLSVNVSLDITPSVTRLFDSNQNAVFVQTITPSITRNFNSNQNSQFTEFCVISAIYGADMIAVDFASLTALVGVRVRGAGDLFSVPGFALNCVYTRLRQTDVDIQSIASAETTAVKIHPFVAEPFESQFACDTVAVRIKGLFPREMIVETLISPTFVVRYYFFPTTFSVNVADGPLADTFFSRTRETGVSI